ncbi:MAG: DNA-formamidopyrimidine glycosylase family protein [Bacteroidota bacterium]
MPELPEVETFKRYIDQTSLNQKITQIDCADNRLLKKELEEFEKHLLGESFTETHRIGKYLFLKTTGSKVLIMHFGMTGRPSYYYGEGARPKYAHITYQFANGYFLGFQNRRKFGWNDLTDNIEPYQNEMGLATDASQITFDAFVAAIRKRKTYIKPVLMDQAVLAGIGNWMADDICYQASIHPKRKIASLSDEDLKCIFDVMKNLIEIAIKEEAVYRNFPKHFFIHIRKEGAICHHTSSKIEKLTVGGRTTFYSPMRQKLNGD